MDFDINQVFAQFKEILQQDKSNIQKVRVVLNPKSYSYTELGRATTTNTVKQDDADLEFQNPLDKEIVVKSVSMIPDSDFKTKGMALIKVNGTTIFKNKAVADFTDLVDTVVEILEGKTIDPKEKLEVFIWSPDGTIVSLTLQVTFGE